MKQNLLIFLLLFICVQQKVQAQGEEIIDLSNVGTVGFLDFPDVDRSYNLSVGPKAGLNLASMNGNPVGVNMDAQMGIGFHVGVAANLHLGRRTESSKGGTGMWGMQAEALFSQLTVGTADKDMTLSYFAMPILAKCYINPRLSIEAGPVFMALMSTSPDNLVVDEASIAVSELKGGDIAFAIGAGYESKSGLNIAARYNLGMSDLAGNMPCKVSTFQISLAWMFSVVK